MSESRNEAQRWEAGTPPPEAFAAAVTEAAPVMLAFVDAGERLRYVNPAFAGWLGLAPGEVLGRRLGEAMGEAAYAPVQAAVRQALGGTRVQFASQLVRRDGELRQVEVTFVPHAAGGGAPAGFVAHVVDCTLQHHVEAQQRRAQVRQYFLVEAGELLAGSLELEATLRALARLAAPAVADGCRVYLVRPEGTSEQVAVHHVNAELLRLAQTLAEDYPTSWGSTYLVARTLRTGEPVWLPEMTDADLQAVAVDARHLELLRACAIRSFLVLPLKANGRVLGALQFWTSGPEGRLLTDEDVAFAQDLARQAALAVDNALLHREVARAEERLRTLVSATSQVMWVTDAEGRILEDSPSWRAFTGQTEEHWRGTGWRDALHPEDRAHTVAAWRRAVATGTPYDVEYRLRRPDGSYTDTQARGAPVRGPDGRVREWVGTNTDITERKHAERQLMQAAEVRELLLAAVSHDLRSPLSAIALCAAALQRQNELKEPAQQAVGLIAASAERMRQMLASLLDFSQARSGTLVLKPRAVDLGPVVQRAVEEVLLVHPERAVALEREGPLHGEFDAGAVARVVSNLVGNAVLYSPAHEPVFVHLTGGADAVVLTVHNRGAPIPPALLPHVFEPFRRGEARTSAGMGLGLYIVRELVAAHGGRVEVSSSEEAGTLFTVTLPRAAH